MRLTSGLELVDELVDGVRVGDNLVVRGAPGVPLEMFTSRCVAASHGVRPVVVCGVVQGWADALPPSVRLLDWHPALSGTPSTVPGALHPDDGIRAARDSLARADEEVGEDAVFVIDSLTAVQRAWGAAAALELFLWACPRLFRRRSIALWTLETAEHDTAFLRRLEDITQVVVDVRAGDETGSGLELEVRKAAGRLPAVVGRSQLAIVDDGDLVGTGPSTDGQERLGAVIRVQRAARGLAQAELARRVGISPSALSQIERGVRGVSGDNLVRIWQTLGVPFGPAGQATPGYHVARRSAGRPDALAEGLSGTRLVDEAGVGALWWLVVEPGARGRQAPFPVKGTEVVTVVRGVVDVEVEGRSETLHEGDVLVATSAVVSAWGNPASTSAELLWHVAEA